MWFRVDDTLVHHPKIRKAAREFHRSHARARVITTWLEALTYAIQHGGQIPDDALSGRDFSDPETRVIFWALQRARLVIHRKHTYFLHDFADYQRLPQTLWGNHGDFMGKKTREKSPVTSCRVVSPHRRDSSGHETRPIPDSQVSKKPKSWGANAKMADEHWRNRSSHSHTHPAILTDRRSSPAIRRRLAAAVHVCLDNNPNDDDANLAEVVKLAAAKSGCDYDAEFVTGLIRQVRAVRAKRATA